MDHTDKFVGQFSEDFTEDDGGKPSNTEEEGADAVHNQQPA
jgi:hypothetical protein